MISFFGSMLKYTVFALLVLAAGQIKIQNKRICDHVGSAMNNAHLSDVPKWASNKFDFTEKGTRTDSVSAAEKSKLSGLLKSK